MKAAIIFNGPPGSGKDESVAYVADMHGANPMQFKKILFDHTLDYFAASITRERFFELYDNRETKDTPIPELGHRSPRQAMIYVSEDVYKPLHGQSYFGVAAAAQLEDGLNAFSDGGFTEELEPVYQACNGTVCIIQLHRDGCTYEGDSRKYIDEFNDVPVLRIDNNGTLEELYRNIDKAIYSLNTQI